MQTHDRPDRDDRCGRPDRPDQTTPKASGWAWREGVGRISGAIEPTPVRTETRRVHGQTVKVRLFAPGASSLSHEDRLEQSMAILLAKAAYFREARKRGLHYAPGLSDAILTQQGD